MANELRVHGRTGYTHYAQIFDESNQVWNGTAFAALSGATWTATDVALAEARAGSGIYLGSFPAGIVTAGLYRWVGYERQSGTEADTDPIVWDGELAWDGSAPFDLTEVPTAAENAAGLLDLTSGVETGWTVRQALRIMAAVLAGKSSGAGTGTEVFRDVTDTKARVTATIADSNRTAITYDKT